MGARARQPRVQASRRARARRASVCRRERVSASPREHFNFDHFACASVRRLNHTAAVNYQGSIALPRKAPIRCQRAFVCVRARAVSLLMRYGCHLQALVCAVNAPFPPAGLIKAPS